MSETITISDWQTKVIRVTTPARIELSHDEVVVMQIACDPSSGYEDPELRARLAKMIMRDHHEPIVQEQLGHIFVYDEGRDIPDAVVHRATGSVFVKTHAGPRASIDAVSAMDTNWRMNHLEQKSRVNSIHNLLSFLEETCRHPRFPVTEVGALTEALHLARDAWAAYRAETSGSRLSMPIRFHKRPILVRHNPMLLGGGYSDDDLQPLNVELVMLVKSEVGKVTIP